MAPDPTPPSGSAGQAEHLVLPDYGGACITAVLPAIFGGGAGSPLGEEFPQAAQTVLLVLDGFGWHQFDQHRALQPTLAAFDYQRDLTTVAPSTTAVALTSLTTGLPPTQHGVVGYRMAMPAASPPSGTEVLNVLRWETERGDARQDYPATTIQSRETFLGRAVPAVVPAHFGATGLSAAMLSHAEMVVWRTLSELVLGIRHLVREGHQTVYAYYNGIDTVAHDHGFDDYYRAELQLVDRLVGDLLSALPAGVSLTITADHGFVETLEPPRNLEPEILETIRLISGEGRFMWLHLRHGYPESEAVEIVEELCGDVALVRTRDQIVTEGWLGPPPAPHVLSRLGDIAVVLTSPTAFADPANMRETLLRGRHGSVTAPEMMVPLLATVT